MSIIYKDNASDLNFDELYDLLKEIGIEKNDIKKSFGSTDYFILAYDDKKLIGSIRALVDGNEWSIIYDLYVKDEYKNNGILEELIKRLIEKLGDRHIFIYDERYDIDFYESLGFLRTKTGFTYELGNDNSAYLPLGYKYPEELFKDKLSIPTHNKSKYDKSSVKIEYKNTNNNDYERINEVLSLAFGRERDINETKRDFSSSEYFSYAYVDGILVGVSRAITDKSKNAFILNVGVDPSYQGLGLGYNIVLKLGEELSKNGYKPFLHTHPGAVGFYSRYGFRRNKHAFEYIKDDKPLEIIKKFDLPKGYRFPEEF